MTWHSRELALAACLSAAPQCAQPAAAQVAPLTATQRANVRLALDNLQSLIRNGRQLIPAKTTSDAGADLKEAAESQLRKLQEIYDNLDRKLAGGNIHPVPGLKAGNPKKYRLDAQPPGTPRAAYCEGDTWILEGKDWKRCPEGDIVVDGAIIDPGKGKPIDATTQRGWQWKWGLLHVLAHEKMHEIMINEQIAILKQRPWWAAKTEAEKRKLIESAKRAASTPERHQQVYEWQKNVLRWERVVLRAEVRRLRAQPDPDAAAIKDLEAKIAWLSAEIAALESAMLKATNDHEFAFAACGWPAELSIGMATIYVIAAGMHWQLQAVVNQRKTGPVTVAETTWLGALEPEKPLLGKPELLLVMAESVYTGLHVQPEPCGFMQEAITDGRILVTRDPAAAAARLPLQRPASAQ